MAVKKEMEPLTKVIIDRWGQKTKEYCESISTIEGSSDNMALAGLSRIANTIEDTFHSLIDGMLDERLVPIYENIFRHLVDEQIDTDKFFQRYIVGYLNDLSLEEKDELAYIRGFSCVIARILPTLVVDYIDETESEYNEELTRIPINEDFVISLIIGYPLNNFDDWSEAFYNAPIGSRGQTLLYILTLVRVLRNELKNDDDKIEVLDNMVLALSMLADLSDSDLLSVSNHSE